MSRTDFQCEEQGRESLARWLLALIAALMLASTLMLEWARIHR